MARWLLKQSHYLNVPELQDGTKIEWEHKETNRTTGRTNRKMYTVPMLLDINNPGDFNDAEGIVVCHVGKGERNDYEFIGDPTPDMEPLDEEAEELSASHRERWEHPINSLPANGNMSSAEMEFMERMMKTFSAGMQPQNQSVPNKDIDDLKALVAKQQEQIAALLSGKQAGPTEPIKTAKSPQAIAAERRV